MNWGKTYREECCAVFLRAMIILYKKKYRFENYALWNVYDNNILLSIL